MRLTFTRINACMPAGGKAFVENETDGAISIDMEWNDCVGRRPVMPGRKTSRMNAFHAYCRQSLDAIRAQGRYRVFTPLLKQAERFPYYRGPNDTEVLVWSSNDYLAMGGHPVLIEAACEAARTMGAGAGGTRNISGTSPLIDALERELADLHGKQAGLLFTSGFVSNQAALSTILNSLAIA